MMPRGIAANRQREQHYPAPSFSVQVSCGEAFAEGYERHDKTAAQAIVAVVEHGRFMARQGAWPAGRYTFSIPGTEHRREVALCGPADRNGRALQCKP